MALSAKEGSDWKFLNQTRAKANSNSSDSKNSDGKSTSRFC